LAILKFLNKSGVNFEEKRNFHLPEGFIRFQFTSKWKKMGTILQNIDNNTFGHDKWLIVKGAVEIVLATCTHYLDRDGNKEILTEQKMKELNQIITTYA